MTTAPLLEMVGIEKSFPGVRALRGCGLTLRAGEVRALLGENGAGKSTLLKILGGAVRPEAGHIRIAGEAVRMDSPLAARRLGAIAANAAAAGWQVWADVAADFPALGAPVVLKPGAYRWPNFLKRENLLNIANQIAVIAIIAVGMTVVIIAGGIDLSVGSLLALAAVLACRFIRDFAGAEAAGVLGMTAGCVGAVLICGGVGALSGGVITVFGVPPFIVTLGVMLMASGAAYLLSAGQSAYQVPEGFVWLGRSADWWGIPNAVG